MRLPCVPGLARHEAPAEAEDLRLRGSDPGGLPGGGGGHQLGRGRPAGQPGGAHLFGAHHTLELVGGLQRHGHPHLGLDGHQEGRKRLDVHRKRRGFKGFSIIFDGFPYVSEPNLARNAWPEPFRRGVRLKNEEPGDAAEAHAAGSRVLCHTASRTKTERDVSLLSKLALFYLRLLG